MPLYRRHNAAFVHVPKTGGQTVEAMLGPGELYGVAVDVELSHLGAAAVRAHDPTFWAGAFTFAFVRDPWDRVVSEYFYRLGQEYFPYLRYPTAVPVDVPAFVRAVADVDPAGLAHVTANHVYPQADFVAGPGRRPTVFESGRRILAAVERRGRGRRVCGLHLAGRRVPAAPHPAGRDPGAVRAVRSGRRPVPPDL